MAKLPTITVQHKGGKKVVVNIADLDPKVHTAIDEQGKLLLDALEPKTPITPQPSGSPTLIPPSPVSAPDPSISPASTGQSQNPVGQKNVNPAPNAPPFKSLPGGEQK